MNILDLEEFEQEDCIDILGEDEAENIGREYYKGLMAASPVDEEPLAVMVWKILNEDSYEENKAEITFFRSDDPNAGKELLDMYGERIEESEVISSSFELADLSADNKKLLSGEGFELKDKEGRDLIVTVGDFAKLPITKKKIPSYIKPIQILEILQFRQGITNCMFCGRTGIDEDISMLPPEWYEQELSCCVLTEGKVDGLLLLHCTAGGILMPVLLFASGVDANKNMLNMLCFSINAAIKKYPKTTRVLIRRHDDKTRKLASYFFPLKKGRKVTYGERTE